MVVGLVLSNISPLRPRDKKRELAGWVLLDVWGNHGVKTPPPHRGGGLERKALHAYVS